MRMRTLCVDVRSIAVDKNKTRQEFAEALVCPATMHLRVKSELQRAEVKSSLAPLCHADHQVCISLSEPSKLLFTFSYETNNVYSFYDLQSRFDLLSWCKPPSASSVCDL